MNGYQLVRLANGAFSVRSCADGETFHPDGGPAAEAEALYVRQLKLIERMQACVGEFVIWDVGLGAAANPITALHCTAHVDSAIRIISFDRTTAALEFALQHRDRLDYIHSHEGQLRTLLKDRIVCFGKVKWELWLGDFPTFMADRAQQRSGKIPPPHTIFYDAYSPKSNPDMWTLNVLQNVRRQLSSPCALATYSRSTVTRTTLLLAGFYVGAGAALAEKEETTVAANDPRLIESLLNQRWLEKARRSHSAEPLHTPEYKQRPLSEECWQALCRHAQFSKTPEIHPDAN